MNKLYQRLKQIVVKRFNCELELHVFSTRNFKDMAELSSQHAAFYRNRKARFFIRQGNIFIPIHETQTELILIEAKGALSLNALELDQLIDTVHLVLKDLMNLKSDLDLSKQRQAYLESEKENNVIPFFRHMFN